MTRLQFDDSAGFVEVPTGAAFASALKKRFHVPIVGMVAGLAIAWVVLRGGPSYESTITIAPAQSSSSTDAGTSALSSFAAITGGSSASLTPYDQFIYTLKSGVLADKLFADKKILRLIFADRWDANFQVWRPSASMLGGLGKVVDRQFGVVRPSDLGSDDVRDYLQREVKVTADKTSAVKSVSLRTPKPQTSAILIARIVAESDQIVRDADAAYLNEQVVYLDRRLDTTTNLDHRQQLALILSDYEKRLVLANGQQSYAVRIVDAAQVARRPASARPLLVILLGAVAGFAIGLATLGIFHVRKSALNLKQLDVLQPSSDPAA